MDRHQRTTDADALCASAYAASGAPETGCALVAVGGYGRRELAPYSDLDVVLVHEPDVDLGAAGEKVWYPIWDSGAKLDHSVRTAQDMIANFEDTAECKGYGISATVGRDGKYTITNGRNGYSKTYTAR